MAWALWNWATPDQSVGYNDYEGTNQSAMNWKIVRGIRATGDPVGAIVVHGAHAIVVVGYQTTLDPLNEGGQTNKIQGMRLGSLVQRGLRQLVGLAGGRLRSRLVCRAQRLEQQVLHRRPQRRPVLQGQVRHRASEFGRRSAQRLAGTELRRPEIQPAGRRAHRLRHPHRPTHRHRPTHHHRADTLGASTAGAPCSVDLRPGRDRPRRSPRRWPMA